MTQKENLRAWLLVSLLFMSFGGWLLHLRIHPPGASPGNSIPALAGLISMAVVVPLFYFRGTAAFGYVLNGMIAIIGTIAMVHFSLKHPPPAWTFETIMLKSLLADIGVLWAKFAVGKVLFELELLRKPEDAARRGRFFRYPNTGWWWVHLAALSVVYILGSQFWR